MEECKATHRYNLSNENEITTKLRNLYQKQNNQENPVMIMTYKQMRNNK